MQVTVWTKFCQFTLAVVSLKIGKASKIEVNAQSFLVRALLNRCAADFARKGVRRLGVDFLCG